MGIEVGQPKTPLRRHVKGIDALAKERLELGPEALITFVGPNGKVGDKVDITWNTDVTVAVQ